MKYASLKYCFVAASVVMLASPGRTQIRQPTGGIGVRGSYWNANSNSTIHVIDDHLRSTVEIGGAGGWVNFLSRSGDRWFIELGLGGIARVIDHIETRDRSETYVTTIVPMVLGMRYHLSSPETSSPLRPYLAFGGGPYWLADITVFETRHQDEVIVESHLMKGAYLGGGFDFMLTNWLGLNLDVKYHFLDLSSSNPNSGYEYGVGVQFMWGHYKSPNHNRDKEPCP